ncbi:8-oxoguanine DNA glycosylase OGG fold protein [Corynebacterium gerontici]|uniref:Uncharacterized protein n=1 Tax=Corynebacterium gerontici TaxID=2079234 RepID=A0A3G6IXC1_9CORY|nr:hypothetical protein [Corynebacterium gerontici]AZA10419.1 hypothetical protein CGERO_00405 [Corynebacterium gerontici]
MKIDLERVIVRLGAPAIAPGVAEVRMLPEHYFPHHWPETEQHLPVLSGEPGRRELCREDLFALGAAASGPEDMRNFYVAVCAWGAGTSALSAYRLARPLAEPELEEHLWAGLRRAQRGDALGAYEALSGEHRVRFLGPAFFSKLMHFMAPPPEVGDVRPPLILDSRVAQALGWRKTASWSLAEYRAYLDAAEELRARWRPDLPLDVVEYQLFAVGKQP